MDCYQKALHLDPDYAWAHFEFGNALRLKGRLDEAHDHYRQVLRLVPTNWEVLDGLTGVLLRLGRGQEAQAAWRKGLDGNPPPRRAPVGDARPGPVFARRE